MSAIVELIIPEFMASLITPNCRVIVVTAMVKPSHERMPALSEAEKIEKI